MGMHIWVVLYIYMGPYTWNPYVATLVPGVPDPDPTGWNPYVATLVTGVLDPDPTGWNPYVATLISCIGHISDRTSKKCPHQGSNSCTKFPKDPQQPPIASGSDGFRFGS
jgi:hypothetical protein